MPWSLVGVSDEARQLLRAAAAESGQTIGAWLNDRILEAARGGMAPSAQIPRQTPGIAADIQGILGKIGDHLTEAERLSDREIESYRATLDALLQRIEHLETLGNQGHTPG